MQKRTDENKPPKEAACGLWDYELSELTAFRRTGTEEAKQFLNSLRDSHFAQQMAGGMTTLEEYRQRADWELFGSDCGYVPQPTRLTRLIGRIKPVGQVVWQKIKRSVWHPTRGRSI